MVRCGIVWLYIYGVGGSERTPGEIDSKKAAASLQIMILREDRIDNGRNVLSFKLRHVHHQAALWALSRSSLSAYL